MILIAIAWIYVVLMVAVVEATSDHGSVLGALFTFTLYGVLPLAIVMYLMLSPARRRARRAAEAFVQPSDPTTGSMDEPLASSASTSAPASESTSESASANPDQRRHAPGDAVAPKREEA